MLIRTARDHDERMLATPSGARALTRYGWPEEVSCAAEFLVTPDSSHSTGQALHIDGGAGSLSAQAA